MTIMRYNNRGTRYDDRRLHERASTLVVSKYIANVNAADIPLGWALYDMELIGGWIELAADDDGTVTVEKWDDQAGSTQTAMTSGNVIDGGVALEGQFAVLTTSARYIAAGEKINLLSATFDGAVAANVTLYFRTVEFITVGS
jgi:hypothetical protein